MKLNNALLTLLLSITPAAWSAEADSEQTDSPAEADAEATQSTGTSKGTEGVFLPSEEISEDFAVSFPVDI